MSLAILNRAAAAAVDGAVAEHHRIMRGQRLELVGRSDEGQAGDLGDFFGNLFGKADRRVEAGADGGAALGEFAEAGQGHFDALDRGGDLCGIAGKFLAERQRRGVLGVGAADLDDVAKAFTLASSAACRCFSAGSR
jgi:hypothetical protein